MDQSLLCFFTTFFIMVLKINEITLVETLTPSKFFYLSMGICLYQIL